MVNSKKKPSFRRWSSQSYGRVSSSWRHQRGRASKISRFEKGKIRMPRVGWGSKLTQRFLHPSGYEEVLIKNVAQVDSIDAKKQAGKIAATVGQRKRIEILKKAEAKKLKILNPGLKVKK